jgi:hypothetical protein
VLWFNFGLVDSVGDGTGEARILEYRGEQVEKLQKSGMSS